MLKTPVVFYWLSIVNNDDLNVCGIGSIRVWGTLDIFIYLTPLKSTRAETAKSLIVIFCTIGIEIVKQMLWGAGH